MTEYINKQALLAEYDCVHVGPPGGARKLIEEAPPADVQTVVHGRWTFYSSYGEDEYEYECSVCNEWANQRYTYCPNCGAHMKDGE